jgi:hypothetical protein
MDAPHVSGRTRRPRADETQGHNLVELWAVPARAPARGRHPGGRPGLAGKKMIADAAAKIIARATPLANPTAEAAGLGPCMIAGQGTVETRGRPTHSFSIPREGRGRRQFQAAAYHVTWSAHHDRPPPDRVGLTYSHLCHQKRCVAGGHGVWEAIAANTARACVAGAGGCPHVPRCLV